LADEKLEVKEMAYRGLEFPNSKAPKLYPDQPDVEIKIPSFLEFVNFINDKSSHRTNQLIHTLQSSQSTGKKYVSGYRTEVYINILRFLRHLMIINADPNALVDELSDELDGEPKLFDPITRTRVKQWIKEQWKSDQEIPDQMELDESQRSEALNVYIGLIEKGLSNEGLIGRKYIYVFQFIIFINLWI